VQQRLGLQPVQAEFAEGQGDRVGDRAGGESPAVVRRADPVAQGRGLQRAPGDPVEVQPPDHLATAIDRAIAVDDDQRNQGALRVRLE